MTLVAVCAMMVALAKQLGLDDAQTRSCGMAGLLLGKVAMPVDALNKPGKLTEAEFDIMKQHPGEGHKMLLAGSGVDPVALMWCCITMKTSGTGTPKGLRVIRSACIPKWVRCATCMMLSLPIAPTKRAGTRQNRCAKWRSGPTGILI